MGSEMCIRDSPYAQRQRAIDFLQPDNRVVLPVAHIKGVTVRTEELYD